MPSDSIVQPGPSLTPREAELRERATVKLRRRVRPGRTPGRMTVDSDENIAVIVELFDEHMWNRADAGEYRSRDHGALWRLLDLLHPIPNTDAWNRLRFRANEELEGRGWWERSGNANRSDQWRNTRPRQ